MLYNGSECSSDSGGSLSVKYSLPALVPICNSPCQNGGTCVAPNRCECLPSWTGPACSVPACQPPCQNGGNCTSNVCVCVPGWTGSTCALAQCSVVCPTGTTCVDGSRCESDSQYQGGSAKPVLGMSTGAAAGVFIAIGVAIFACVLPSSCAEPS